MSNPNTQGTDPDMMTDEYELGSAGEPLGEGTSTTDDEANTTGSAEGDVEADTASGGSPD